MKRTHRYFFSFKRRPLAGVCVSAVLAFFFVLPIPSASSTDNPELEIAQSRAVINKAIELIEAKYVYEDKAREIGATLRTHLANGRYDQKDLQKLTVTFHEDLQDASGDPHMAFSYDPEKFRIYSLSDDPYDNPTPEQLSYFIEQSRKNNAGAIKAEWMEGGIGYLQLNSFWWHSLARQKIDAAMSFLSGADALIIDLRVNSGGRSEAVRYLQSYFFSEPTHVLNFHDRRINGVRPSITMPPGVGKPRFDGTPVYILTSDRTASAAEDFAMTMRRAGKATIVGENTLGAGHTVTLLPVLEGFLIAISTGHPVDPVSGIGWQGTGVSPDIESDESRALFEARMAALNYLKSQTSDALQQYRYDWAMQGLQAQETPPQIQRQRLRRMTGKFGPRRITYKNGSLYFSYRDHPPVRLIPVTETIFQHSHISGFRIRFLFRKNRVYAIEGMYEEGYFDYYVRSK